MAKKRKLIKVESIGKHLKLPKSIYGLTMKGFMKKKPIKIRAAQTALDIWRENREQKKNQDEYFG